MNYIRLDTENGFRILLECDNEKCGEKFWADADAPIKDITCTHCGSREHHPLTK